MSAPTDRVEPRQTESASAAPAGSGPPGQYVVVARRYRPQTFDELIGQQHVAQALSNAISTNRVGHAYLFTGARGVGKTSAARILAKALNCENGPSPVSCNRCDVCRSVSSGEDVDVLEIDGASNRGIDEIRQLRQNVNVRPSRARFKIYIIDEVHMLTREAFNALLKTLEEPPEHVKFIFCTTEPTKIPITILSRCQRFDFAGILTGSIARRLAQIVEAEGVEADSDALEVLARRAAGSMRDSQSLLEQLLAFSPGRITLDEVHGMLGTAGDQRLTELARHLVARDAAAALADLDTALGEGVDVAQLLEQLFGYFRDCMAATVGCPGESFLYASPTGCDEVVEAGRQLGLNTVLAVMQILDQTLARLRFSTQGRILAELALVRICALEDLDELPALIAQLLSGAPPAGNPQSHAGSSARASAVSGSGSAHAAASVSGPASGPQTGSAAGRAARGREGPNVSDAGASATREDSTPPRENAPVVALTPETAVQVWTLALGRLSGMVVDQAREFDHASVAGPNRMVISFKPRYALAKSSCERPDVVARFERALAEVTGHTVRVQFTVQDEESGGDSGGSDSEVAQARATSPHQKLLEVVQHPMIRRAGELFGAQPTRVDDPPNQE
ncbi:MAG: DNA polymerase III subunit gamma/tau [Pirellulales bacterium]|nr:DNA polymerase III subunit gamma/tau [Pirellulales bacterium]